MGNGRITLPASRSLLLSLAIVVAVFALIWTFLGIGFGSGDAGTGDIRPSTTIRTP
jgi:hypothetical protein